mmetsp:Transcript_29040/g.68259  ORF Transcript_29040/g.68259 Transcript_29040/m.68259 type:complete len:816 (+) Transcript_29040:251-2698(+)
MGSANQRKALRRLESIELLSSSDEDSNSDDNMDVDVDDTGNGNNNGNNKNNDNNNGNNNDNDNGTNRHAYVSLLDESLEDARTVVAKSNSDANNFSRNRRSVLEEWLLAYNRGLVLLSKGWAEESIRLAWSYLKPVMQDASLVEGESTAPLSPPLELACRMAFLILEGMLALYPTRSHGQTTGHDVAEGFESEDGSSFDLGLLDAVLAWVTENVDHTKAPLQQQAATPAGNDQSAESGNGSGSVSVSVSASSYANGPDPQLKFLLSLYQSRVNFFERTTEDVATRDKHMRSARKELKQAMEIFQHKLRPERSDTSSVGTFSSYSEEVAAATGGNGHGNDGKQSPVPLRGTSPSPGMGSSNKNNNNLSRILQGQNQAALNLKANAEQLKGNLKKSLILCGEAQSFNKHNNEGSGSGSGISTSSNYYDAIHQNNLGIVYESSGKSHLALHAFSKAVRSATDSENKLHSHFESDGTATPNVTLHVLNNAAVCALKSRNYSAAYECYAIGLATANSWRKRPRTWLRLSEACIGLNAKAQKECTEGPSKCSRVEVDGQAKGVLLTETFKTVSHDETAQDGVQSLPALGSPEDLKGKKDHALKRAGMALRMALKLFDEYGTKPDDLALQSARLSFAYVCLEDNDFKTALQYSTMVLNNSKMEESNATKSQGDEEEDPSKTARQIMIKRQTATARMYASEANANLGDPTASMKVLVGDGKDDAFDRLSFDLGGVTLGMASANNKAKARLAKAQTMVRCSAAAASAAGGNLTASKQLAMSAQAVENSYSSSREGTSHARKALIYCMLREGNHGAALNLLRSAR